MFEQRIQISSTAFSSKITEKFYTRNKNRLLNLKLEQEENVKLLRQYPQSGDARALTTRLSRCAANHRCRNVVCAYCYDAARRYFKRKREKVAYALLEGACKAPATPAIVKPQDELYLVKKQEDAPTPSAFGASLATPRCQN